MKDYNIESATMSSNALPTTNLKPDQPISAAFRMHGCDTFRQAAEYIRHLPYGRNSAPTARLSVLEDRRGTCSSKHALVAALGRELGLDIRLILGIYEMDEQNTPGIGPILESHDLSAIPEAHCWIEYKTKPFDLTSKDAQSQFQSRNFIYTEVIDPEQTGPYKTQTHRVFMSEWLAQKPNIKLGIEQLWNIRERCIGALS